MGDIIKIRRIISNPEINGLESPFSSSSEAEEPISNNTSTFGQNELNSQIRFLLFSCFNKINQLKNMKNICTCI